MEFQGNSFGGTLLILECGNIAVNASAAQRLAHIVLLIFIFQTV